MKTYFTFQISFSLETSCIPSQKKRYLRYETKLHLLLRLQFWFDVHIGEELTVTKHLCFCFYAILSLSLSLYIYIYIYMCVCVNGFPPISGPCPILVFLKSDTPPQQGTSRERKQRNTYLRGI